MFDCYSAVNCCVLIKLSRQCIATACNAFNEGGPICMWHWYAVRDLQQAAGRTESRCVAAVVWCISRFMSSYGPYVSNNLEVCHLLRLVL